MKYTSRTYAISPVSLFTFSLNTADNLYLNPSPPSHIVHTFVVYTRSINPAFVRFVGAILTYLSVYILTSLSPRRQRCFISLKSMCFALSHTMRAGWRSFGSIYKYTPNLVTMYSVLMLRTPGLLPLLYLLRKVLIKRWMHGAQERLCANRESWMSPLYKLNVYDGSCMDVAYIC